jgi:segregation and condensation protein B
VSEPISFPSGVPGADEELVQAVEALLFASGEPVSAAALAQALEVAPAKVEAVLHGIEQRRRGSGVLLERIAAGWQLRTAPRFGAVIHRLLGTRPQKLSRPALEVLSIVAYRQPTSRAEIDRLRGVDSGGVLKSLLDRGLLRTAGRSEEPGRPLLYRTTDAFLELFSLPDLAALPTPAERKALTRGEDGPGAREAVEVPAEPVQSRPGDEPPPTS